MKIREITIGDLSDFIRSEEYEKLQPKPITPLRAISQVKNPHARKEDVALVFASENNTLLAFAGLLPHAVSGLSEPVFSNSGWWVHPKLGRKLGLSVFLKAFQRCRKQMFFTDCTAHTKSILEKTGLMTFLPVTGNRFFLRFYSGTWLLKRGKNRFVSLFFSTLDRVLNSLIFLRFPFLLKKRLLQEYSIQTSDTITADLAAFIEKHPGSCFLKQDSNKLNWIVHNPWITTHKKEPVISYPFTYRVNNFKQEFLVIQKRRKTVALLLLSIRDNHASVPFIYFKKNVLNEVAHNLWFYLIQSKTDSLVVFHPELTEALKKGGAMWFFQKKITRFAGYSKELNFIFEKKRYFQDGEGDVVFT
jgi:hypothetical protein